MSQNKTLDADEIFICLRDILCEILVLNEDEVTLQSSLVDDLDADSIAFLELTYRIRSDFGLQVPQAKVDEQTLQMPLLDGLERLEASLGGTTLFEFMKQEALHGDQSNSLNILQLTHDSSKSAARKLSLAQLAEQMQVTLPSDFNPDSLINSLRVRDLFRFITVASYVGYIQSLAQSQERIAAMGGADAMNAEAAAAARGS